MSDTKYSWDGDWEAPGYGRYVICDNDGREMEPGEVVGLLDRLADLEEQIARTARVDSGAFDDLSQQIIAEREGLWRDMSEL
jgi:hypothetical protein